MLCEGHCEDHPDDEVFNCDACGEQNCEEFYKDGFCWACSLLGLLLR